MNEAIRLRLLLMHSDDDHPVVSIRPIVRMECHAAFEVVPSLKNLKLEASAKESYINTMAFYARPSYEKVLRIEDLSDIEDDKLTMTKRFS